MKTSCLPPARKPKKRNETQWESKGNQGNAREAKGKQAKPKKSNEPQKQAMEKH